MPRSARLEAPGAAHHLISRFVNKAFRLTGDSVRSAYLARVSRVVEHTDWRPLSYCLMSSHIHWVALGGFCPSCTFIQPLHSGFAGWLNREQGTLGPVFAERHRSDICSEGTLAGLLAYVHNNPVRAGVVADPADTDWSSHRAYLGLVTAPPWLDVERGLAMCGFSSTPSGRLSFHEFVLSQAGRRSPFAMTDEERTELRVRVREAVGLPLEISDLVVTDTPSVELVAARSSRARPRWPGPPTEVLEAVAQHVGVPTDAMQSRDRTREVVKARRLALFVWSRELGHPQSTMARLLGLGASSACELLRSASTGAVEQSASRLADQLWREIEQRKTEKPNTVPSGGGG
jgi:putative transposase